VRKPQHQRDREAAREFWEGLDSASRWTLGDALVLGDFDWRDWFTSKPTRVFLDELDQTRIHWEADDHE